MPFLAYIAIVLVSISAILFEINWLTKPKLETNKPAAQVASTAVPPREVTKVERPEPGPSPVVAASPTAASASEPAAPPAPAPASTTEMTAAAAPVVAAPATPSIIATPALAMPAPSAPPAPAAASPTAASPAPQSQPQQTLASQAPNSCDVQGCAAAYQSFRASDCTYQPFDGARRICEKPPEAGAKQAAEPQPRAPKVEAVVRKPNKDAELRDVERAVRQITTGDNARIDRSMGDRSLGESVIVIERPARDW